MVDEATKILKPDGESGDDNPLIPDKIEKDLKKSKFGRWILWAFSLVLVPVIGWAGDRVIGLYNTFEALRGEVHDLQRDKTSNDALWKSLGDQRNQLIEVRVQHEAFSRLFEREFSKSVLDRYIEFKLTQEMAAEKGDKPQVILPPMLPTPLPIPLPVPAPKPTPKPPKFDPRSEKPEFKLIDPDQYRKEQEQKFPRQSTDQYKK